MATPRMLTQQQYRRTPSFRKGIPYKDYLSWYGRRFGPRPVDPLAPMSQQAIEGLIGTQVNAALAPGISQIKAARGESRAQAAREAANQAGFSEALAELLGSIGDKTRGGYQQAADSMAAYGKGFSGEMRASAEADAAEQSRFLETVAGAPAGQVDAATAARGGEGVSDLLYGAGGYIPATTLGREGAAFGAAADNLPAMVAGLGKMALATSAKAARDRQKELDVQHGDLLAKVPGLRSELLMSLLGNEREKLATKAQLEYLGLQGREKEAGITGIDPATGLPTVDVQTWTAEQQAKAAKDAADAATDRRENRTAALKAKNAAFDTATTEIDSYVQENFVREVDNPDPIGAVTQPKIKVRTPWKTAREQLWRLHGKPLMRFAAANGRNALRSEVMRLIDQTLASYGIKPPPKPKKPAPNPAAKAKPRGG